MRGLPKMSKFAEKVARYYMQGIWTKKMVEDALIKGRITQEEYEQIVGEDQ